MHKLIYVCSPLRGDIKANREKAIGYSRQVYKAGFIPITPHAYLTLFLDDNQDQERKDGMVMGITLLKKCDEVWVFGDTVSYGMAQEIEIADKLNIPVRKINSCRINKYTKEKSWCYGRCETCIDNEYRAIEKYSRGAQARKALGMLEGHMG